MAQLGRFNTLTATRETLNGLYLDGGELGELLLPRRYIPDGLGIGGEIEVFVYRDSEDRLVATTERPRACVGEFACMHVKDIHERAGAFLDWGLGKDLLLPYRRTHESVTVVIAVAAPGSVWCPPNLADLVNTVNTVGRET